MKKIFRIIYFVVFIAFLYILYIGIFETPTDPVEIGQYYINFGRVGILFVIVSVIKEIMDYKKL